MLDSRIGTKQKNVWGALGVKCAAGRTSRSLGHERTVPGVAVQRDGDAHTKFRAAQFIVISSASYRHWTYSMTIE